MRFQKLLSTLQYGLRAISVYIRFQIIHSSKPSRLLFFFTDQPAKHSKWIPSCCADWSHLLEGSLIPCRHQSLSFHFRLMKQRECKVAKLILYVECDNGSIPPSSWSIFWDVRAVRDLLVGFAEVTKMTININWIARCWVHMMPSKCYYGVVRWINTTATPHRTCLQRSEGLPHLAWSSTFLQPEQNL